VRCSKKNSALFFWGHKQRKNKKQIKNKNINLTIDNMADLNYNYISLIHFNKFSKIIFAADKSGNLAVRH